MRAYSVSFKFILFALILIGAVSVFLCFFYPPVDEDGIPIGPVQWNPGIHLGSLLLTLCLPYAVYLWKTKPQQTDLLPDICMLFGIIQIIIELSYFIDLTMVILYSVDLVLSIGIVVSAMSFKRGDLHCQTRLLMLLQVMLVVQVIKICIVSSITGTFRPKIAFFAVPEMFAFLLLCIAISPICLYPKDFPGPRLSQQLKDLEYTMTNKDEMYISEKDFLAVTGKDMSEWHPSDNPLVECEYEAHIIGAKTKKLLKASKWKGEDDIYISIVYRSDQTISWGTGQKIIFVAEDSTASSLKGRVIRLYTEDGFFYRLIVLYYEIPVKNKVRNKLSRFFEDF